MFDNFNHLINVAFAILLTVAPHFVETHKISPAVMKSVMAEAEKRAAHIIETGDTTELAQLESAVAELEQYRPMLEKIEPLMQKIAARMPAQGTEAN